MGWKIESLFFKKIKMKLFDLKDDKLVQLTYSTNQGLLAKNASGAIIGMRDCIEQSLELLKLKNYEIVVLPFKPGSHKILFAARNKITGALVTTAAIIKIINGGFDLINNFGAFTVYNDPSTIINSVEDIDAKVLAVCQNQTFIEGARGVIAPLQEANQKVTLSAEGNKLEITCESQKKFFENLQEEKSSEEDEIIRKGEVYGKIVKIDIDASIRQIDFKVYGEGERIQGTLSDDLNVDDYISYLGKYVEISGLITTIGDKTEKMEISSIIESEPPDEKFKNPSLF